ncbi:putative zinc-binding protein [Billgrantia bachuensis]|uniref:putative zinc-binding protein n=1 Tax=Billgrantia bachuensis TaxID=2717286 RepID=UPI0030B7FB2F
MWPLSDAKIKALLADSETRTLKSRECCLRRDTPAEWLYIVLGGTVRLVCVAHSGRLIVAIDACQMHCTHHCLAQAGAVPTEHVKLYERGLRKRRGQRYDEAVVAEVAAEVGALIARL